MPTLPPLSLSDSQRDELTQLLASNLGLGNIEWLAEQVLTPTEFEQLLRQSSDTDQMASQIVESIHQAGRMRAAFELLLGGSDRHGYLVVGLKKILAGESLTSGQQLQRFLSEFEPFLSSNKTTRLLPRVGRTICLVAVTKPEFMIMGTGFLIAHDIVITAHHVIEDYLDLDPATGEFVTVDDGKDLLFFFDYLLPPPPDPSAHQSAYAGACVHAANPWLIKARSKLPWDGTDKAPRKVVNEYDYVVIRLERSIGLQPPQRGMGRPRGWLPLVDTVDYNQTNRRLFLFQHPGSAEQQFDIGTYVRLDRSSSRVWYTVSAARGSSGGAAVDTDGNLFALHNAEVRFKVRGAAGELVNQGIRIDLIAKDVGALVPRDPVPDKFDQAYWSLSDDLDSARPILGRAEFRQAAARMMADEGERTLMVLGPPQSGRHFSISLFQRVFPDVPIVILKPDFLQQASPAALLRRVTEGLGIFRSTTTAIPEPPATMSRERWLTQDLTRWLLETVSRDQKRAPTKYPALVVIDTVTPPGESLSWAEQIPELLNALLGMDDAVNARIDIPQLRWLVLGDLRSPDPFVLSIRGPRTIEERLDLDRSNLLDQFAECVQLAFQLNSDELSSPGAIDFLRGLASKTLTDNDKLSLSEPWRAALSRAIASILAESRRVKRGGNS